MEQHHFLSLLRDSYKRLGGYKLPLLSKLRHTWELARLYDLVQNETLLGLTKISSLYRFLKMGLLQPGAMAEIGVYKGGAAKLMATLEPVRKLYLFDTFEGMPGAMIVDDLAVDGHKAGDFVDTSFEAVSKYLKNSSNVVFRKGFFPDTALGLEEERFCFVHIDGDLYQSTLDALRFFYPRMSTGGVMVFDDYEWGQCPGVKIAMDEYLAGKPEKPFVKNQHQAVLIKQ